MKGLGVQTKRFYLDSNVHLDTVGGNIKSHSDISNPRKDNGMRNNG